MYIPDYKEEPFEWYKKMRNESPVTRSGNTIHIFKYKDITSVLSNYRIFSSQFRDLLGGEMAEMMNQKTTPSILILDPPVHTTLRNLVSDAFTPATIESYQERIRKIASGLIENMRNGEWQDAVTGLSYLLPITVISEMLGVPQSDSDLFRSWSDKLATSLGRGPDIETQYEMADYFYGKIDRKGNKDNLISRLSRVELDGRKLTDREIAGFAILLLVAGNETTTNLITNALLSLYEYKRVYSDMRNNPDLIPSIVEETLRYRSPVQSTRRYAKVDTELNGVEILKDDILCLYLGSANRDESMFPDGETFNPRREAKRHIAFGQGIHFCLGAPLARMEAQIVLEEFSRNIISYDVKTPAPGDRLDSDIMYGFRKMLIKPEFNQL
jgi:cytochrome P450